MGRPSNRAQRRAEIVGGLRRVMAERGYEAASIGEVARVAGLTPGLIHYHFQSKQEILVALVHELSEQLERRLAQEDTSRSPRARLEAAIDAHLSLAQADPEALACWVVVGAEAIRQPPIRRAYAEALSRRGAAFTRLLREALREAGMPTRGARAGAAGLSAAIEGYFQLAAAAPGEIPRGSAARTVRRMLSGLLER